MATLYLRPNAAGDETNITNQYPNSDYHWDKVDEVASDGVDTTVHEIGSVAYVRDLYSLEDVSQAGTINWIKVWINLHWDGAVRGFAYTSIKTGGVAYDGDQISPPYQTWGLYSTQYSTNPQAGGAWTWEQLNALQVGLAISVPGGSIVSCTQVYVEVDYTPAYIGFHSASAQRRYKAATFSGFTFPDPAGTGFTAATDGYSMLAGWGVIGLIQVFLSGTLYSTGSLGRKIRTSLAGTLTSTGTLNIMQRYYKVLYGTVNFSGTLSGLRIMILGGVLNLSGTLNRLIKKGLSGTLNSAGGLVSRRFKVLAGRLNFSGALDGLARFSKTLAGTLNLSGSLGLKIKKNLAGVLNASGTLGRKIFKKLSGSLNLSGVLSHAMGLTHKALAGTLNLSGSLGRKIRKTLAGTLSLSGVLTSGFYKVRNLTVTLVTKQYRDIQTFTKQYRVVDVIIKQYRKIRNFISGGG